MVCLSVKRLSLSPHYSPRSTFHPMASLNASQSPLDALAHLLPSPGDPDPSSWQREAGRVAQMVVTVLIFLVSVYNIDPVQTQPPDPSSSP